MVMEVNENKDELNKDDLNKAREKIGAVDRKMAELFCERMNAVRMVADYKREHGLPIFDASREADLLARNLEYIGESDIRSYYTGFLESVIELSKKYQHRLLTGLRIAYSGVEGAFAHIAATRIFPDGETVSYQDFPSAYEAVVSGECDCCVLPVENLSLIHILICPKCGGSLIERKANKGVYAGRKFYGCSNYPKCKYIRNIDK